MQEDGRCRLPRSALKQWSLKFWDLLRVTRFFTRLCNLCMPWGRIQRYSLLMFASDRGNVHMT
jgi:hypothetical protein